MSMTTASAEYFEQVAGQWDELRAGYFSEKLRDAAIARAYLRPEMKVADVGAGTGFMAAGLAPLVAHVTILDGSPAMLEVARQKLAAFSNVAYRQADGTALPLEDGSLDAVFANMYLHHCPDPLAAIKEMVRVLKPGGRLVITDMQRHGHEWMRREMADEWLGFERSQVKAWLREAGLVNLIVDDSSQSCCAQSASQPAESARIGVFVATGSRQVAGTREEVRKSYGAAALAGTGPCGCGSEPAAETSCCAPAAAQSDCCSTQPAQSSCCSPTAAMSEALNGGSMEVVLYDTGYAPDQLAAVPGEAAQLSLGCGNPTAMASLRAGEVVLDIGSGGGIDVFYAARRVGPGGKAIGLDMTPAMIDRARRSAQAAGLQNVEFRLGQAEAMPVEDGTVDVILSNCVINLTEDKGKVFEEAYRVLKPGGRLSISDMVTGGPLPGDLRGDPKLWAGCINGALPEQEYLDLVKEAGFGDVTATRTLSGGEIAGVPVYSLAVTARKAAGGCACGCGQ